MYQGFYINLDRSDVRRKALSEHLEELGLASRYTRVSAVDGRAIAGQYQATLAPAALGCWLSHIKTIELSRGCQTHVHIMEDDTILARDFATALDQLIEFADAQAPGWDLIFTDIDITPADGMAARSLLRTMKNQQHGKSVWLVELQHVAYAATSSFLVNRRSIEKYADLIKTPGVDGMPIDLYIRKLLRDGALRAYVTVPFLTSISPDSAQSDIAGKKNSTRAVFDIYRRIFFQDSDVARLDAEMNELIVKIAPTPREMLYLKALLFVLSDEYESL